MENNVQFQLTMFTALDGQGKEGEVRFGYRIFDAYAHYCEDGLTRDKLVKMTPQDALLILEETYDEFYESILDKGFYFNGHWIAVDEMGVISN